MPRERSQLIPPIYVPEPYFYTSWRDDVKRSKELDFTYPWGKKDLFWRMKSRKSTENVWDYDLPISSVDQVSLKNATAIFENNQEQHHSNLEQIKANNERIVVINKVMTSSDDPAQIRNLAMERNQLNMANGSFEAENEVYKKTAENALKVIHTHRGDIAEFYKAGPYMTEFKAAGINGFTVALTAGLLYYYITTKRPGHRPFWSQYRRTPIGASF